MSEHSFYLLTYDIADPRRLVRVAKLMEAIGERVQDSVFEAYLSQAELEKLLRKAAQMMEMEADSLRVYSLCQACRAKIRCVGIGKSTAPPGVVII